LKYVPINCSFAIQFLAIFLCLLQMPWEALLCPIVFVLPTYFSTVSMKFTKNIVMLSIWIR
jgi:hypothetical protein